MTLDDLIQELEDAREQVGGEVRVYLAQQPSWPFEYSIGQIAVLEEYDFEDEEGNIPDDAEKAVYIGEASQLRYLPGVARRALGWS